MSGAIGSGNNYNQYNNNSGNYQQQHPVSTAVNVKPPPSTPVSIDLSVHGNAGQQFNVRTNVGSTPIDYVGTIPNDGDAHQSLTSIANGQPVTLNIDYSSNGGGTPGTTVTPTNGGAHYDAQINLNSPGNADSRSDVKQGDVPGGDAGNGGADAATSSAAVQITQDSNGGASLGQVLRDAQTGYAAYQNAGGKDGVGDWLSKDLSGSNPGATAAVSTAASQVNALSSASVSQDALSALKALGLYNGNSGGNGGNGAGNGGNGAGNGGNRGNGVNGAGNNGNPKSVNTAAEAAAISSTVVNVNNDGGNTGKINNDLNSGWQQYQNAGGNDFNTFARGVNAGGADIKGGNGGGNSGSDVKGAGNDGGPKSVNTAAEAAAISSTVVNINNDGGNTGKINSDLNSGWQQYQNAGGNDFNTFAQGVNAGGANIKGGNGGGNGGNSISFNTAEKAAISSTVVNINNDGGDETKINNDLKSGLKQYANAGGDNPNDFYKAVHDSGANTNGGGNGGGSKVDSAAEAAAISSTVANINKDGGNTGKINSDLNSGWQQYQNAGGNDFNTFAQGVNAGGANLNAGSNGGNSISFNTAEAAAISSTIVAIKSDGGNENKLNTDINSGWQAFVNAGGKDLYTFFDALNSGGGYINSGNR